MVDNPLDPSGETSADDIVLYGFLKQAESARSKRRWETAVKIYTMGLEKASQNLPLRLGLAQVLEHLAEEAGDRRGYYQRAMAEYRTLIIHHPEAGEAHDGLFACADHLGELEALLDDYRRQIKERPQVEAFRQAFYKAEQLYLMRHTVRSRTEAKPHKWTKILLEIGLPLFAVTSFLGWVYFNLKAQATNAFAWAHLSLLSFLFWGGVYILYKVFRAYTNRQS